MTTRINKDGWIELDPEALINNEAVLLRLAQNASFSKWLIHGLTELLLRDEVDWDDGDVPWRTIVSFGRSQWEEARAKLIAKADEAAQIQVEKYKGERDTFERYYNEGNEKRWRLEKYTRWMEGRLGRIPANFDKLPESWINE